MESEYFKKITTLFLIVALLVLSFFLLRPIIIAIILGIILAFIFIPIYDKLYKILKVKNLSALLVCILLLVIIIVPLWYFTPVLVNQSIKVYMASQQMDFVTPLKNLFPSMFQSETFSNEIGSAIHSFVTNITNSMMNSFSKLILNFPTLFLQFLIVLFTFFFILKDRSNLLAYLQSLSPFTSDVDKKFFKSSRDITFSILYGQVVLGLVQGLVAGAGFFIFRVPNALFLTLLACAAGIFPIIGTSIVWIPVMIYLIIGNNLFAAMGVALFGIIASVVVDSILKTAFISKRTELNSSIILIGMIGGLFLFGILGVIIGPLVLAYLLIILEIYRKKKSPDIFNQEPKKE